MMMEKVVIFGSEKNLVGILSEGADGMGGDNKPAVILLNSGLVHRVGPNRIYVKLARRLARQGIDVLRFDFAGIGDSSHRKDNLPFSKGAVHEVRMAMDLLGKIRVAKEFILIGICSGAEISIQCAHEDQRVVGAVPINIQPPSTAIGNQFADASFYIAEAASSISSWRKFISGKSSYRDIAKAIVIRMRLAIFPNLGLDFSSKEKIRLLKTQLKVFRDRDLRLLVISSKGESGAHFVRRVAGKEVNDMMKMRLLNFEEISTADHMFTPLKAQERLFEVILKWVGSDGKAQESSKKML
jgi:pimeloyl-ACP methyl ester carboxylesterase